MVTCSPYCPPPPPPPQATQAAHCTRPPWRDPRESITALGLICPLSAAVLFASLLVLVEEKETGGACFQYS